MHVVEDTIDMDDIFLFDNIISWCYRDEYDASLMGPIADTYFFGTNEWFNFQDQLVSDKTDADRLEMTF